MNIRRYAVAMSMVVASLCTLTAQAGTDRPPVVPLTEIRSVTQAIAVSGDSADIYYPDPAGSAAGYRFPVVVYLQGANVDKQYYSQFGQQLASYGFIVVIPNHPGLFTATSVLTEAFEHVKLEDLDTESPLFGIVDRDVLVPMGHSFGGVAALVSLNSTCFNCASGEVFVRPPELKAVVATAGNAGILDLDNAGIPTAIIVGELNANQAAYADSYDTLVAPRALMHVEGADHFGMADINEPPGASIPDEPPTTIPQSVSVTRFAHWSGQFLRTWLYYDFFAWWALQAGGDEFVSVTTDP